MFGRPTRSLVSVLAIFSALACSDGTAAPSIDSVAASPPPVVAKPTPTAVRLVIPADDLVVPLGSQFSLAAYTVMSDSSRVPVQPTWSSLNDAVLAVNAANGYAVAVAAGRVGVIASINTMKVVAFFTVLGPESVGQSDALVVESFSMVEFQYPSALDRWFYAPQMRAHAALGRRVSVLVLRFAIPGLGNAPAFGCGANLTENPRDLFGEIYGDWLLSFDATGYRATGDPATVTITYLDEAGMMGTQLVTGPVVHGNLPTTYSGGGNGGACFHGYGSTG